MYRSLFILLSICVVAVACKKESTPQPPPSQEGLQGLMPLHAGNFWFYNKTIYDSATGTVKSTVKDTISIIDKVIINDVVYYQQNQVSIPIKSTSFFYNTDSNTVMKIDSASKYTFFKRVPVNGIQVDSWVDTVKSRCTGHNYLYAYTADTTIKGYTGCLKNEVLVNDCTGLTFQKWVYYLKPKTGLVRIEHYLLKQDGVTYYPDFVEELTGLVLQ